MFSSDATSTATFFLSYCFTFICILASLVLPFSSSAFCPCLIVLKYTSVTFKLFSQKDKSQVLKISSLYMNLLDNSNLFTAFISNHVCSLSFYISFLSLPFHCARLSLYTVFQGCLSSAESRWLQTHLLSHSVLFFRFFFLSSLYVKPQRIKSLVGAKWTLKWM